MKRAELERICLILKIWMRAMRQMIQIKYSHSSRFTQEPLHFVHLIKKGVSDDKHTVPYGHIPLLGERYFKGYYLKFVRSKSISFKQLQILPTIISKPDEIYYTYVDNRYFFKNTQNKSCKLSKMSCNWHQ